MNGRQTGVERASEVKVKIKRKVSEGVVMKVGRIEKWKERVTRGLK